MTLSSLVTSNFDEKFDQIIVFGAKGWLGRSAVSAIRKMDKKFAASNMLLIGSKTESIVIDGQEDVVHSFQDVFGLLKHNALLLNYAFLRREKLQEQNQEEYLYSNFQIMETTKELINHGSIKSIINASSGVAGFEKIQDDLQPIDLYAWLKSVDEIWFEQLCTIKQIQLINCRIFSMSGRFINEYRNLAISQMVVQALETGTIDITSPNTERTYIDAEQLNLVLLGLALTDSNYFLDSGGELVTMLDLAETVKRQFRRKSVEVQAQQSSKVNRYFGDFRKFNGIAESLGIDLINIDAQVAQTILGIQEQKGI